MHDDTPRPWGNGYALSLYDELRRDIRDLRADIAARRRQIGSLSREMTASRLMLVQAERTLAWMQTHQADEIAELEAARARVRAILRAAR